MRIASVQHRISVLARLIRPSRRQVDVAMIDLRRWMAGYCNALAHHPDPARSPGGYAHWRCDRRRGHDGRHRGINYTWTGEPRSCSYDPVDSATQRLAALAVDSVDLNPLATVGRRELLSDSYAQLWRGYVAHRRRDALRGISEPTPGQLLMLLRRPGATLAALGETRRLLRDLDRSVVTTNGTDLESVRYVAARVGEKLDDVWVLR